MGHVAAPRALCHLGGHHAERGWFFYSLRDDLGAWRARFGDYLRRGEVSRSQAPPRELPSAEAAVVVAGLVEADRGPDAAEEAMAGAAALQRMKLEKRLAYLGYARQQRPLRRACSAPSSASSQAFDELGKAAKVQSHAGAPRAIAPQAVMTSIAEALVATAIGLLVAIPAVAAYNTFQRLTKSTLANTEVLSRISAWRT